MSPIVFFIFILELREKNEYPIQLKIDRHPLGWHTTFQDDIFINYVYSLYRRVL